MSTAGKVLAEQTTFVPHQAKFHLLQHKVPLPKSGKTHRHVCKNGVLSPKMTGILQFNIDSVYWYSGNAGWLYFPITKIGHDTQNFLRLDAESRSQNPGLGWGYV